LQLANRWLIKAICTVGFALMLAVHNGRRRGIFRWNACTPHHCRRSVQSSSSSTLLNTNERRNYNGLQGLKFAGIRFCPLRGNYVLCRLLRCIRRKRQTEMEDLEKQTKRNLDVAIVLLGAITQGFGSCTVRHDKATNTVHITPAMFKKGERA